MTSRITTPSQAQEANPLKTSPSVILNREEGILDPPQSPEELGRLKEYRISRILGEGGMGVVYLAWDSNLHRSVALKIMKKSIAENEASRKRFLLEARATAAIDHDHIVTIFQVGDHNGVPYLVMKHLEGQTLEDRLRKEKILSCLEAVRIGKQVAEGLEAAHKCNLIHRDIKPSNIWLEAGKNRVKILDFGLARIADSIDTNITQTGVILGTPAYMSPEQAAGLELDGRSDLFSLGTVLYRMVTGKPPFRGSNNLAILRSLSVDIPVPPHEVNPQITPRLSKLIIKLLEKDPDSRPSTAEGVSRLLETIEQDLSAQPQAVFHPQINVPLENAIDQPGKLTDQKFPSAQLSIPEGPSSLSGLDLDNITLAPVDDEQDVSEDKKSKPKQKQKPKSEVEPPNLAPPKRVPKPEVSPLLRKLAEQAALQDEIDEETPYIVESRSAAVNQWKRQQYWENFPWRPILFTLGLFVGVIVLSVLIYTFWPEDLFGFLESST